MYDKGLRVALESHSNYRVFLASGCRTTFHHSRPKNIGPESKHNALLYELGRIDFNDHSPWLDFNLYSELIHDHYYKLGFGSFFIQWTYISFGKRPQTAHCS